MAFVSAKGDISHEHNVRMRRAKYASATKSKSTWYHKQIAIADSYEKEAITNMSDKEFVRFMRSKLESIFKK